MGYRVPDEVHQELVNWSRWCWLGEWPCEAASEPGWIGGRPVPEDDDQVRAAPPNERHALVVQAAWERMDMQGRLVLRAEYPARDGAGRPAAAARLGLTLDRYDLVLAAGVGKVEEAIDAVCA